MQELQSGAGLSNEDMGRLLHVTEKTWRRWKEKGEVPNRDLAAFARAVKVELATISPQEESPYGIGQLTQELADIRAELRELQRDVRAILERI